MFPLQRSDDLFFQISSNPNQQQQQQRITQDQILSSHDHHQTAFSYNDISSSNYNKKKCPRKSSWEEQKSCENMGSKDSKKKMMHRDLERQRRQEMATLYASLRSLLPLEFIKGKRSISDQMNEAVNYIQHLQRNIKELRSTRDELITLSSFSSTRGETSNNNTSDCSSCHVVVVHPSLVGVEIVLSTGFGSHCLRLSRVLQLLLEEGLCVLGCVSLRVGHRLIHTIQGQVNDPTSIDISELQDKLTQM